ncbi:unnamed protein product [Symbiodinium sp. CCMP2456]|nr:unnamed protein product [Symbiodinium sp. CCMP2456]
MCATTTETLLDWADEELEVLAGSKWQMVAHEMREDIIAEHAELEEVIGDFLQTHGITQEKFLWAHKILLSRAMTFYREGGSRLMVLGPGQDMFNHSCEAVGYEDVKLETVEGKDMLVIRAFKPFAEGEQAFYSYSPASNGRLLLMGGFVVPENPFDSVELMLTFPVNPSSAPLFQQLAEGVRREILDCIYLYEGDLQHLSMTSATIQSQCSASELQHIRERRICHLDLTLPVVDVSACPWNADVLEVAISPGLAVRSYVLRNFLPRCTCLRHIHLRLMPDPGWHLVQWAQGTPEAVTEAERHDRVSGNDSDALVLAKLSRCRARASPLHHFNQSLKAILESLKDNLWCPNLSGVSMIAVLPSDQFSVDRVELCTWKNEPTTNKRGLVHDFVTRICFRNEDSFSSEDQWRELPCLSGYLLVGTPSLNFFQHGTTSPENDVLGSERVLPCFYGSGCDEDSFAMRSRFEAAFCTHYASFSLYGKPMLMRGDVTVQVPGIFPGFACVVGKDMAARFIRQNPEYGEDMVWETLCLFYEESGLDMQFVRDEAAEFADSSSEECVSADGETGVGRGIHHPHFQLPRTSTSDAEAAAAVAGSSLAGLEPRQPGVAAQTWQELAAVATQCPDITWLGRVVLRGGWAVRPKYRFYNDFPAIHQGQTTDLRLQGHRARFGEKCMKYGSIDLCVRTLSLWPNGEPVGQDVLDLFHEICCVGSFNHYWPKVRFFLNGQNFATWVQPHLSHRHAMATRQEVANTLLVRMISLDTRSADVAQAVRRCREDLQAEPTVRGGLIPGHNVLTAWDTLFGRFVHRGREALQAYDLMLRHGAQISVQARGGKEQAETLRRHWERAGGSGDWTAFVQQCEDMTAFTAEGISVLRS